MKKPPKRRLSHLKIWSGRSDSNTLPLAPHAGDRSDPSGCFIRITALFASGKTSVFLCLCKRKHAASRGGFAHNALAIPADRGSFTDLFTMPTTHTLGSDYVLESRRVTLKVAVKVSLATRRISYPSKTVTDPTSTFSKVTLCLPGAPMVATTLWRVGLPS